MAMQEPLLSLAPRLARMHYNLTFLHRISSDPSNEAEDLILQAKKYKQEYDRHPKQICADQIYINTKKRKFCIGNNIRLSGKRLDRPRRTQGSVMPTSNSSAQTSGGETKWKVFWGSATRKYSLHLTMAQLAKGPENWNSMAILVTYSNMPQSAATTHLSVAHYSGFA